MLSASLTFVFTAAVVYFLMILPMSRYKERQAAKNPVPEAPPELNEVDLLAEIRDLLAAERNGSAVSASSAGSGDPDARTDVKGSVGQQRDGLGTEKS